MIRSIHSIVYLKSSGDTLRSHNSEEVLIDFHRIVALVILMANDQNDMFAIADLFQSLGKLGDVFYTLRLIPIQSNAGNEERGS